AIISEIKAQRLLARSIACLGKQAGGKRQAARTGPIGPGRPPGILRQQRPCRNIAQAEQRACDPPAFDGYAEGLPDPPVVERRPPCIEAEIICAAIRRDVNAAGQALAQPAESARWKIAGDVCTA